MSVLWQQLLLAAGAVMIFSDVFFFQLQTAALVRQRRRIPAQVSAVAD